MVGDGNLTRVSVAFVIIQRSPKNSTQNSKHFKAQAFLCFVFPFFIAGLQGKYLPSPEVEWSSPCIQWISWWLFRPRPFHVGFHLETWFVLCQWKGCQLSRSYYRQQIVKNFQEWKCSLFNKVSHKFLILMKKWSFVCF